MITVFPRVTPCSVIEFCQIFDGTRSFQLEVESDRFLRNYFKIVPGCTGLHIGKRMFVFSLLIIPNLTDL